MKWLADIASGIVSPVATHFTTKSNNKTKIKQKQIQRLMNAENKVSEWEEINAENASSSWKDEWITLVITLPIPVIFISVILSVLFENPSIANAANSGVTAIKELVPNYAELLYIVCLAAIGIKAIRK